MGSKEKGLRESWHADRVEEAVACWREVHLEPDSTYLSMRCLEICGDQRHDVVVDVAVEVAVEIVLNGHRVASLPVLPVQLREMAVGFLIGEGLVESFEDIVSIELESGSIICETHGGIAGIVAPQRDCQGSQRRSMSGPGIGNMDLKPMSLTPINSDIKFKASDILKVVDQLNEQAKLWRRTGATHTSIICDSAGRILASCEDVGRSSSVDKAVGAAILSGVDLSRCALVTSGRLSEVMVAKAARAGFPVLVSRSAPVSSGVELAQKIGMTLVGFARPPRLYIYSGEDRIE